MTVPETFWQMAGMTTALGMGVVFVALLLLSVYMHFFKQLTARLEANHRQKATPASTPAPAPTVAPAPRVAPATEDPDDPGSRTAAAVAVALRLAGVGGAPAGEVAAAIATALGLHRARASARLAAAPAAVSGWRVSGRMAAMAARVARQERVGR